MGRATFKAPTAMGGRNAPERPIDTSRKSPPRAGRFLAALIGVPLTGKGRRAAAVTAAAAPLIATCSPGKGRRRLHVALQLYNGSR